MKILMIAPEPVLEPRGTPISIYHRLFGLSTLRHEVDLVTYHIGADIHLPGLTIHRIPRIPFVTKIGIGPSWLKPLLDLFVFFKSLMLLMVKRYDVIHSHEEAAFFAMLLAWLFRTHHLYDMHSILSRQLAGSPFGHYHFVVHLFRLLEQAVIRSCDTIIVISAELEAYVDSVSPATRKAVIDNLPVQAFGGQVQEDTVNALKQYMRLNGREVIVYTGTFEHYQALDLLIESVGIVVEQRPQALFLLVGGKPHQIEQWHSEVTKRGLEKHVLLVGAVPLQEVEHYLELADVLVSPRTEGLSVPLKIYSYLYSGKPVVATQIKAHTLVLDEAIAVLVQPNPEAFAEGILRVLAAPEESSAMGQRAKQYAELKYSFSCYLSKLETLYQSLQPKLLLEKHRGYAQEGTILPE